MWCYMPPPVPSCLGFWDCKAETHHLPSFSNMCIRVTERYAACRCVYHVHGVDACQFYGRHPITERTVYVGYACPRHSRRSTGHAEESYSDGDTTPEIQRPCSYDPNLCIYAHSSQDQDLQSGSAPAYLFDRSLLKMSAQHPMPAQADGESHASLK